MRPRGIVGARIHGARIASRDPLHILKEWNDGKGQVVALEKGKVGDVEVERVAVSHRGAATILSIDPKTGRVLLAGYRGRMGGGIGQVTQTPPTFAMSRV